VTTFNLSIEVVFDANVLLDAAAVVAASRLVCTSYVIAGSNVSTSNDILHTQIGGDKDRTYKHSTYTQRE